jgi:hypothetical protein
MVINSADLRPVSSLPAAQKTIDQGVYASNILKFLSEIY